MLMRPMPVSASFLLALLVAAALVSPPQANAVEAVPDEPGTIVLPDAPILQTVVADVDADGLTDLVRLVRGDGDAALVEIWVERGSRWELLGDPLVAVPASRGGPRTDPVYLATPVRLLVRRVGGVERVTVASQPHFEEIDIGEPCCLLLNDLVVEGDAPPRLASVAEPADVASSVLVIDLDGDGTDEILSTFALPLSAGLSPPILARVHRWTIDRFARPTVSELQVGFGGAPFVLGDSDGLPGDEAAIISTLGSPGLFRIRLIADEALTVDSAGLVAEEAMAVPLDDGRGVAVRAGTDELFSAAWPPGERLGEPVGRAAVSEGTLVGTLEVDGAPHLGVRRTTTSTLDLLRLPDLSRAVSIPRSAAAARLSDGPPVPYVGVIADPGSTERTIVDAGRLVRTSGVFGSPATTIASLAGVIPIGPVGDGALIALHHGPIGPPPPTPGGGPFTVPGVQPVSWTTIAPRSVLLTPERDGGYLELETPGGLPLGNGELAVGPRGFTAEVPAPPGSRVLVAEASTLARVALVVPDSGSLSVPVEAPADASESSSRSLRLLVLTPAGHAYEAIWHVLARVGPPPLEVGAMTPLGSSEVEVAGSTVAGARVVVDGRSIPVDPAGRFATRVELPPWPTPVAVEVDDAFGNVARATVVGIGLFDYRGLPWLAIVASVVGAAAIVLFLRVPRTDPYARRADDDARLEELEPD